MDLIAFTRLRFIIKLAFLLLIAGVCYVIVYCQLVITAIHLVFFAATYIVLSNCGGRCISVATIICFH